MSLKRSAIRMLSTSTTPNRALTSSTWRSEVTVTPTISTPSNPSAKPSATSRSLILKFIPPLDLFYSSGASSCIPLFIGAVQILHPFSSWTFRLTASIWQHPDSKFVTACYTDKDGKQAKRSTERTDPRKALAIALDLGASTSQTTTTEGSVPDAAGAVG